jgi:hypothetical protein
MLGLLLLETQTGQAWLGLNRSAHRESNDIEAVLRKLKPFLDRKNKQKGSGPRRQLSGYPEMAQ